MNKLPTPNMVPYLGRLSAKEKAIIIYLMRAGGSKIAEAGTLPFLPVMGIVNVLNVTASMKRDSTEFGKYVRSAKEILVKLAEVVDRQGPYGEFVATWLMKLDSKKVYRRFGSHPERGKPLSFLPKEKVSVGVKWSLPKKDYVIDHDVLVAPCVTLKRHGGKDGGKSPMWEVTCKAKCRHAVEIWLLEQCQ